MATKNTKKIWPAGGHFPRAYRRRAARPRGRAFVFFNNVAVVVPNDAKKPRSLHPIRVAAGDSGNHRGMRLQSKIENPKSKIS